MSTANKLVWIVDDDDSIRWVLQRTLQQADDQTKEFTNANEALIELEKHPPHCIITDIKMPGINGIEFMQKVHQFDSALPVIIITAHADLDSAILAYNGGAFEYLPKPFDIDDVLVTVKRALALNDNNTTANKAQAAKMSAEIIGDSPAMQTVFRMIGRLSKTDINVLINGESGTGKELVANALHRHSPRANQAFVALNMAAIPESLLESELFGHEKGAFTGATSAREGRFEQADGGTLFLDEIGDMPLELQSRLLRVLAEGTFYRLGGHQQKTVNVRVLAATHQNLEELVATNQFRADLFHRLNVIRIDVPPLRERQDDIAVLMTFFLEKAAAELHTDIKTISPEVDSWIRTQTWPGNVRQLENLCRWLAVMANGSIITVDDLPDQLSQSTQQDSQHWETELAAWIKDQLKLNNQSILDIALPKFETVLIKMALAHTQGKKHEAAKLLGWGRNTLTRKLKELKIN